MYDTPAAAVGALIGEWISNLIRGTKDSESNSAFPARPSGYEAASNSAQTVIDTISNPGIAGSSGSSGSSDSDRGWLAGLLTNSGYEAELNRKFNSSEAEKERVWQSRENTLARDFQLMMSNTAYQRGMADLKAAGLNPILAYSQGGAANSAYTSGASSSASYQGVAGSDLGSLAGGFGSLARGLGDLLKVLSKLK